SDEIDGQYVNNNKGTYVAANGYLDLTPFKGFSFRSLIGVISANSRTGMFFGPQSIANITAGYSKPLASIDNNYDWSYKWENILNYNFKIAESHDITLTGITSWSHFQHENNYSAAQGQELTSQSFHNLAAGTLKQGLLSSFTQSQAMSYAARINYSYLGRYLLTVSNRWDGVSHLADGHKWDMFPAAALGWRISDEAFMENTQEWLSNLKLRIGYGVTGNSGGMGPYSSKTKTQTFPKPVVFGNASAPVIQYDAPYENPNIGWEKSYNTNIGIDAGFLNGRIDMALDIYHTKTKDLLFKRQLPITAGVTMWGRPITMWQNIGETSNKGIELMLNTRNIIQKNFTWASVLTFTANKEKIEKLPDGDLISESLFLGKPSRAFYDYKYLGIWKENEAETAALYGCVPGDIKLATNPVITKDENGNEVSDNGVHKYSDKDKMFLGAKTPDWYLGFQNNFTFYDFDASIFMMLRVGQTLKSDLITRYNPTTSTVNSPSGIDYYTPENQNAYLPRPGIHGSMSEYYGFGSLAYRDGSFLKIKNITLGYTLPKKVLNAIKMEKIRFYATAYNPLIWAFDSELKGQDPERNGSDNFPLTKEFVFGVNITF
ncbi:MAG: SusC/RagA family TonB-linked outer membrane protein, partial [Bacteroidales bacterium]